MHTYIHTYIYTYIHTYIHTYINTYIHTYIHTYIYELADQLAKEAASENDINECYKRIPKSEVLSELNEVSVTKWQSEWDLTTKGAITKSFFPIIAERLKQKNQCNPKLQLW